VTKEPRISVTWRSRAENAFRDGDVRRTLQPILDVLVGCHEKNVVEYLRTTCTVKDVIDLVNAQTSLIRGVHLDWMLYDSSPDLS
jgi:hypothetical protein